MYYANKRAVRRLNKLLKTLDKVKNNDFFIGSGGGNELSFKFGSDNRLKFHAKMTEAQISILEAIRYLYD